MTGEMYHIDQDTGVDDSGDCWPIHLAIAKATGGTLQPFDKYQGPYIAIGPDLRAGSGPYAVPVRLPGIVRLWVCNEEVYREDTEESAWYFPYDDDSAVAAALMLLGRESR